MKNELLAKEIEDKYGEWLEMGLPLSSLLIQLLINEKQKNIDLQKRLEYYEDKIARLRAA